MMWRMINFVSVSYIASFISMVSPKVSIKIKLKHQLLRRMTLSFCTGVTFQIRDKKRRKKKEKEKMTLQKHTSPIAMQTVIFQLRNMIIC